MPEGAFEGEVVDLVLYNDRLYFCAYDTVTGQFSEIGKVWLYGDKDDEFGYE